MLERDMEELIARYPSEFFPRHEFTLIGRQGTLPGVGRYDLLFEDVRGTKILMELKAGPAKYADADQLAKYYNALKDSGQKGIVLWLVATSIQHAVREVLDNVGIEYSEIHPAEYVQVARKYDVELSSPTPDAGLKVTATTIGDGTGEAVQETASQGPKEDINMGKYRGTTVYVHVLAELVRAAQYRGLTTYQDLAVIMGLPMKGAHMGKQTGEILGDIVEDEVSAGRPMLSAVVVGVGGKPGAGFFNFAREIGRMAPTQSEDEFWHQELEEVYTAWRRPLPR